MEGSGGGRPGNAKEGAQKEEREGRQGSNRESARQGEGCRKEATGEGMRIVTVIRGGMEALCGVCQEIEEFVREMGDKHRILKQKHQGESRSAWNAEVQLKKVVSILTDVSVRFICACKPLCVCVCSPTLVFACSPMFLCACTLSICMRMQALYVHAHSRLYLCTHARLRMHAYARLPCVCACISKFVCSCTIILTDTYRYIL